MQNTQVDPRPRRTNRDPLIGGLVLILVGAGLLVAQVTPDLARYVVIIVGLGLLTIFLVNRSYGALIGGSIVTGVGVGIILSSTLSGTESGAAMLLSLGAGFLAIWPLAILFQVPGRHWWPLVPGLILVSVGAALWIGGSAVDLIAYWPVILIAIGVILIGVRLARPGSAEQADE